MGERKIVENMDKHILISIVIIVRNEGKRIKQCIDSLVGQKGIENCEIIFVDGNSTDNTLLVINPYLDEYRNFKLIKCDRYGYSFQRNVGVLNSAGEYILFISGDTVCDSKIILKYIKGIHQGFEVMQGTVIQNGISSFTKLLYKFYQNTMNNDYEDISTVNIMIKKILFCEHMFDERLIASEDKIWFLTIDHSVNYRRMKNCVVFHTVHENINQYAKKIHKESIGIGTSLALNFKLWRKHNYFGWISLATLGSIEIITLVLLISFYIIERNFLFLAVSAAVILLFEFFKTTKYKINDCKFVEILILEKFMFNACTGIIKGIIKGFGYKYFKKT